MVSCFCKPRLRRSPCYPRREALGGRRSRGMPQLNRGGWNSKRFRSEDMVSREETGQTNKKKESLNLDPSFLGNHKKKK